MLVALFHAAQTAMRWLAYAAVALLSCAMLVTVADVALRAAAKGALYLTGEGLQVAVPGVVDIVQLFVIATAYFAIPFAFMTDNHVTVDIVTDRLPWRLRYSLHALGALIGVALMAAILVYGWDKMLGQVGSLTSQEIGIPIVWYWVPLLVGAALSVVATALVFVRNVLAAVAGRDRLG